MEFDYSEAFKALQALNEETFEISAEDSEKLKKFLDGTDEITFTSIVDTEAKDEEELEDSYEGKAILKCNMCGEHIFKNPSEVIKEVVDEVETGDVNVEDECPICHSFSGYKVVGEVAGECQECEDETDDEEDSEIVDVETKDEYTFDDALDEALGLKESSDESLDVIENKLSAKYSNFGLGGLTFYVSDNYTIEGKDGAETIIYYKDCINESDFKKTVDMLLNDETYVVGDYLFTNDQDSKDYDIDIKDDDALDEAKSKKISRNNNLAKVQRVLNSLKESSKRDDIDADADNKKEKAKKVFKKAKDDADADRDYKLKKANLTESDKPAAVSIKDAQKWVDYDMERYGKISDETNELIKKAGFQIIRDDHDRYEVTAGKYESCNEGAELITKITSKTTDEEIKPTTTLRKAVKIIDPDEYQLDYVKEDITLEDAWNKMKAGEDIYKLASVDGKGFDSVVREKIFIAMEEALGIDYDVIYKTWLEGPKDLTEDTVKQNGKWVNKGEEGTHGSFKTKKEADAQRKAMFAQGYKAEELEEDFNKVDIETDTQKMSMESDENGKVTVTTEPIDKVEETEEIIEPVSDEMETKFKTSDEEDYEDVEFDEFDEEKFDTLGEKYLKRVYENVEAYKTKSIKTTGNTLKLEGIITFKSGKEASTTFIFESKRIKNGKYIFEGLNKQFAKGNKAFTLVGLKNENKLIAESLTYHYTAKDGKTNESTKLYGRVKI